MKDDHQEDSSVAVVLAWFAFATVAGLAAAGDVLWLSRKGGGEAAAAAAAALQVESEQNAGDSSKSNKAASEAASKHNVAFIRQIAYWLVASSIFNCVVWGMLGAKAGGGWLYGYILEYLLSVDNLFVFRMVFSAYSTPASQVDRALYMGVALAVVLRIAFFGIGTEILGLGFIARLFFGLALVYSGIKTVRDSDDGDDDDPKNNLLVRLIGRLLPLYNGYTEDGSFFIRVGVDGLSEAVPPTIVGAKSMSYAGAEETSMLEDHAAVCAARAEEEGQEADMALSPTAPPGSSCSTSAPGDDLDIQPSVTENGHDEHGADRPHELERVAESQEPPPMLPLKAVQPRRLKTSNVDFDGHDRKLNLKVTLLFMVVITLGIIDVIFAVDSVTAKISSIASFSPKINFFLNLTSSAFAMFVLRSVYFLLDMMVHMFRFLNYGVGVVLALIGVKLILSGYVEVGMIESCLAIMAILLVSIIASAVLPKEEEEDNADVENPNDEDRL